MRNLALRVEAVIVSILTIAGLLMLAACPAGAQQAQSTEYGTAGAWIISRRTHDCSMTTGYDNQVGLQVRLDQRRGEAALILLDPSFRSLVEGREYSLDVYFQSGTRLIERYPESTFMPLLGDSPRAVASVFHSYELLPDLAANDTLIIMRGTAIVAKLSLADSAAAITLLRACAAQVARENPSDPFE